MTGTATPVTEWAISYTDDEGVDRTKWFPIELSQYGGQSSLWRVEPPLDGHLYILICDRGALLHDDALLAELDQFTDTEVPTVIPALVEVFAANPDGSVNSMTTLREPISLNRTHDGINIDQILAGLGYTQ